MKLEENKQTGFHWGGKRKGKRGYLSRLFSQNPFLQPPLNIHSLVSIQSEDMRMWMWLLEEITISMEIFYLSCDQWVLLSCSIYNF